MRHINTYQIDNHCWVLEVTDGYVTQWTAKLDGSNLEIFQGDRRRGRPSGYATLRAPTESGAIGIAMAHVANWAQVSNNSNEPILPSWQVIDEALIHHRNR